MNDDPVIRRARTNWRLLAAWVLMAAAMALALALGVNSIVQQGDTNTKIVALGTPCVRVEKGPHKGQPSEGCERLARLLNETCLRHPKLCPSTNVNRLSPGARAHVLRVLARLVSSDALKREIRRQRADRRAARRKAAQGPRGLVPGHGGPTGGGGRGSPSQPGGQPTGSPPAPSPGSPPATQPGKAVQEVLKRALETKPNDVIQKPVPTLKHLTEPLIPAPPVPLPRQPSLP